MCASMVWTSLLRSRSSRIPGVTLFDRVVDSEERWHTIGAVAAGSVFKVLLVVHTYPDLDDDASGSGSLACVKPIPGSGGDMKSRTNDRAMPPHLLTEAQIGQLKALEGRAPDTVDIPPAPETNWATAVRGKHSAAIQGTVSVCLDAEVMAWLRAQGPNCGAEINLILRAKMAAETVT
jgi:uncharacterized protein (DUF4415 family)